MDAQRSGRPDDGRPRTVEEAAPDLAGALARLAASPSAGHEVEVALAYERYGIADQAHAHFASAARMNPSAGAAWDGLARIWRDWGMPWIALGDAYRAAWAAPASPAVQNTLGTVLQHLNQGREARARFTRAIGLDPGAAYARNNLCYSWLLDADTRRAAAACLEALAADPGLVPARNNLALAKAVEGDLPGAETMFEEAGGRAAAQFNLGIVYLSQRRFGDAVSAFERASDLQPGLTAARTRAQQARAHAAAADEGGKGGDHERR